MRSILIALTSTLCFSASAQITPDLAAKALDSFAFMHPQEKIFVHNDRDIILTGETIWFKVYVTLDGRPTTLSKVVYVELANAAGEITEKRMLRVENGAASGEISVSHTLASGTYSLNAYTLWMLNFPQFIFKKNIGIHNLDLGKKEKTPVPDFSVQFLPEGGNLVAELEGRVAFKATDAGGMPLNISGNIIDGKKNVIATIDSRHDGLGFFTFTPQANETYMAVINGPGGNTKSLPLPKAMAEGIVMTVNNDNPNRVFVQFTRSETNKAKYNELLVIAQINYEIVFTGKVDFDAEMTAAAINKKNLPPGILQITAMNMNAVPLTERLVFINNFEVPASSRLKLDTVNTKKGRNFYTLDLSGYQDLTASAAVVDRQFGTLPFGSGNIISSLLLTSDLKGYVHDPGFYFRNKDTSTTRALDLLMMTQGWRRFNWESVVKYDHPVLRFPFETGIAIKGKLTAVNGKQPMQNGKMELITKADDSTTILSTATLDARNEFSVYDLNFRKSATVFYQGTNLNKQQALVNASFYPSFFDSTTKTKGYPDMDIYNSATVLRYWKMVSEERPLNDSTRGKTLATVTVTGRKRTPLDSLNKLYATEIFQNSDQTLPLDTNAHYFDIWQFLSRSVPGIDIRNTDSGKRVTFSRYAGLDAFSESGGSSVQFFLNEVPVPIEIVDALFPDDVGLVKIFKGNTANILGADRGAIAIYTKKGVSSRDWRKRGFDSFKLSGYSVAREFYVVDRDNDEQLSVLRSTLYWNPEIKADANGKAVISFFNDRVPKKFQVVIQGIDKNGKLLTIERMVE